MATWLITVQEDMLPEMLKRGVIPSDDYDAVKLIKPGDSVIVYVSKYYARKYGGSFVLYVRVKGDWREKKELVYPTERVTNKLLFPYEAEVEVLGSGNCRLKDLVDSLSFIENRLQLSKYVRGIPANLKKPLPEGDVEKIVNCIKSNEETVSLD